MSALTQLIDQQALLYPNCTAISCANIQISFSELKLFCVRAEAQFLFLSKTNQTKRENLSALMLAQTGLSQILTLLALGYNNIPIALSNPRLTDEEIARQIELADPSLCLNLPDAFFSKQQRQELNLSDPLNPLTPTCSMPVRMNAGVSAACTSRNAKNTEVIIFSSGSTGQPKAICHTWQTLLNSAQSVNQALNADKTSCFGLALAICHVGGLAVVLRALLAGTQLIVPENTGESALSEICKRAELSHISLVPRQMDQILQLYQSAQISIPTKLRAILLGGSAVNLKQIKHYRESKLPIYLSYGMSEAASTIAICELQELSLEQIERGYVYGKILPHLSLTTLADHKTMHTGEIQISGKSLFKGYLTSSGELKTVGDLFLTGDIGSYQHQKLQILGRKDRMFISGGENIYPEEIEQALNSHPDIDNCHVVAAHSARWGKQAVAFYCLRTLENPLSSTQLRSYLATKIAKFKIPRHFILRASKSRSSASAQKQQLIT